MSNSATDKQVLILETRGKETQLYNTMMICLGIGDRKKHTRTTDKLFLQVQTSVRGSSSTLGIDSTFGGIRPGLGQQHSRRISTLKEDVKTVSEPSPPGSPPGTWPE
jgi:hypothetical protein